MSLEELREFLQERIAQTFFYSDDVVIEQLQDSMTELRKLKLDLPPPGAAHGADRRGRGYSLTFCGFLMIFVFSGKLEELPRNPLGQELPVLLSPLQAPRGRLAQAGGLHISSISPDQSPSKDPRDPPLPSPDPVIIHSQAPLTPDGSPLTGPPPYQPPEGHSGVAANRSSPLRITDAASEAESSAATAERSSCRVPWTLVGPAAPPASGLAQSGSLCAAEQVEDAQLVQLLEEASASTARTDLNQDPSGASETQTADERIY